MMRTGPGRDGRAAISSWVIKMPGLTKAMVGIGRSLAATALSVGLLANTSTAAETPAANVDQVVQDALKLTPDPQRGRQLFFSCAVCHTPEGWGSPSGHYPQIAGQHRSVVIKQLEDIYKGNRDNPTMIPFTTPLLSQGPQALADIAAYVEGLRMVPNNKVGPGYQLERGKSLYKETCSECHGENGEGKAAKYYPRIQGQHFSYLQRQLHWIKEGKRRNADKEMMKHLRNFSYEDMDAVADYVSRMPVDQSLLADHKDWRNPDFRAGFVSAPKE
jgi:cytochrome c553